MLNLVKRAVHRLLGQEPPPGIPLQWAQRSQGSWMNEYFTRSVAAPPTDIKTEKIEKIAAETNALGPQPLWEGYRADSRGGQRFANEVRTDSLTGKLYIDFVRERKPNLIVEFGTAFGVSGMHWLTGLEANGKGRMLTFEPNVVWAKIAQANLERISDRFVLTVGTFEDKIDGCLSPGEQIDLAFIDAIHTPEFVIPQLDLVVQRAAPRSLIILDDINFSDDMKRCWEEIAVDARFASSATLGERVGLLELKAK